MALQAGAGRGAVAAAGTRRRWLLAGVVALAAAVSGPSLAAAAPERAEPRTPGALLEGSLKPILAHVRNIQIKIEHGVGSVGTGDEAQAASIEGWAAGCCARNVVLLREKLDALEKQALSLVELYRKHERQDGVRLAGLLVNEARRMRQRLEAFAKAKDAQSAREAFEQMRASTFALQADRKDLVACCDDLPLGSGSLERRQ